MCAGIPNPEARLYIDWKRMAKKKRNSAKLVTKVEMGGKIPTLTRTAERFVRTWGTYHELGAPELLVKE